MRLTRRHTRDLVFSHDPKNWSSSPRESDWSWLWLHCVHSSSGVGSRSSSNPKLEVRCSAAAGGRYQLHRYYYCISLNRQLLSYSPIKSHNLPTHQYGISTASPARTRTNRLWRQYQLFHCVNRVEPSVSQAEPGVTNQIPVVLGADFTPRVVESRYNIKPTHPRGPKGLTVHGSANCNLGSSFL